MLTRVPRHAQGTRGFPAPGLGGPLPCPAPRGHWPAVPRSPAARPPPGHEGCSLSAAPGPLLRHRAVYPLAHSAGSPEKCRARRSPPRPTCRSPALPPASWVAPERPTLSPSACRPRPPPHVLAAAALTLFLLSCLSCCAPRKLRGQYGGPSKDTSRERDRIWKWGLCPCKQVMDLKMASPRVRVVLSQRWVPTTGGRLGHRDRTEGSHVRHWRGHMGTEAAIGEASTPQGAPRTAWGHQNPGATPGTDPAPDPQKEPDLPRPWPRPSGLQACEGVNLRCLKPPGLWACVTAATGRGRSCRGRRRGGVGTWGWPGPWGKPAPVPSLPGPPCSGASQTPASPPRLRPGRWSHSRRRGEGAPEHDPAPTPLAPPTAPPTAPPAPAAHRE